MTRRRWPRHRCESQSARVCHQSGWRGAGCLRRKSETMRVRVESRLGRAGLLPERLEEEPGVRGREWRPGCALRSKSPSPRCVRIERNDGMSGESDDLAAVGEASAQVGVDAPDQLEGLARRRPARHAARGEVGDQLLVQGLARGARDIGIRRHAIPHAVKVTIGGVGADGLAVCILGIGAKGPGDGGATHDARDASGQEVLGAVMELLGLPCRLRSMCRWLVSFIPGGRD